MELGKLRGISVKIGFERRVPSVSDRHNDRSRNASDVLWKASEVLFIKSDFSDLARSLPI